MVILAIDHPDHSEGYPNRPRGSAANGISLIRFMGSSPIPSAKKTKGTENYGK